MNAADQCRDEREEREPGEGGGAVGVVGEMVGVAALGDLEIVLAVPAAQYMVGGKSQVMGDRHQQTEADRGEREVDPRSRQRFTAVKMYCYGLAAQQRFQSRDQSASAFRSWRPLLG